MRLLIRAARYPPQASPITNTGLDVGEIYVSGNELYYNDVSGGHQVKITSSGNVNAGAGSITGLPSGTASATFSSGTFVWQSATSTAANLDFGSAVLRNSGANSYGLTLQPPSAMGANITETLPAIPSVQSFMAIDTSGNMSGYAAVSGGLTTSNLSSSAGIVGSQLSASANISGTQLSATAGIVPPQNDSFSAGSGVYYAVGGPVTGSNSFVTPTYTGLGASISGFTTTRPCFVNFQGGAIGVTAGSTATFNIERTNGVTIHLLASYQLENNSSGILFIPSACLNTVDFGPDSFFGSYRLYAGAGNTGGTVYVNGVSMQVFQV